MSDQPLTAVILAAGLGTRMRSRLPKVLHPVAGVPMIDHVVAACREAGVGRVVVVVNPATPEVATRLPQGVRAVVQERQLGTGHALAQVPGAELAGGDVVVLNADSPLLRAETIRRLVEEHRAAGAAASLSTVHDPGRADGRVIRDAGGGFDRIVEHRDAGQEERRRGEINVGLYCFRGADLVAALGRLRPDNAAGELYLTDVFRDLRPVHVLAMDDPLEGMGINDRVELARAEAEMRRRVLESLMRSGVTVRDPASTVIDAGIEIGRDTVIEPFTLIRGATVIGSGCRIGPLAQVHDARVGDRVVIDQSWVSGCEMGDGSDCGPFAKLRPGTVIGADVHVGSFAELVRTTVGRGSRVPHVSYLGDAGVGENVNIGAGTITANFDKVHKNRTVIEDDVFVGVGSMLRAPVRLGRGSSTGAGSVVLDDVEPGQTVAGVPARPIRRRASRAEDRERESQVGPGSPREPGESG